MQSDAEGQNELADEGSDNESAGIEPLVEEFLAEIREGGRPTIESYAAANPQMAEEIRELFPIVAAMEGWKEEETVARGGNNSLGGVPLQRLGDFRIVREIGRGGMGIVFEAMQESLDRPVAIKVLPPTANASERANRRFRREAQTAASLHHSNIVPVFGIGQDNGFSYIVMQRIDGCGLDQVLHRRRGGGDSPSTDDQRHSLTQPWGSDPSFTGMHVDGGNLSGGGNPWLDRPAGHALEPRLVARLGLQAADALQYAHEAGTLHRDIKPANLLLDQAGHLWVADFGLARALEQETISHSGDIVGTLLYMAPERLNGSCDERSDIYSLGVTLAELVTGRHPFATKESGALVERIMRGIPSRRGALGEGLPVDLETILLKAMSVDPTDRYQTVAALSADLQAFVEDRPVSARQPSRVEMLRRWARRNPALAGLTATVATLLVLTATLTTVGLVEQHRMRRRTEGTLDTLLVALDTIYNRFAAPQSPTIDPLAGTATVSDETADMLQQLLAVYDELASQGGDTSKLSREAVAARLRVADIHLRLGAPDKAAEHYRLAVEDMHALRPRDDNDLRQWQLRECDAYLGQAIAAEWKRRDEEAESLKLQALDMLQPLAKRFPENVDIVLQLARSHYLLGRQVSNVVTAPSTRAIDHRQQALNPEPPVDRRHPGAPPQDGAIREWLDTHTPPLFNDGPPHPQAEGRRD